MDWIESLVFSIIKAIIILLIAIWLFVAFALTLIDEVL